MVKFSVHQSKFVMNLIQDLSCFSNLAWVPAATIFAYGQTSSGKTFTMRGVTESAIADIFEYIQRVCLPS